MGEATECPACGHVRCGVTCRCRCAAERALAEVATLRQQLETARTVAEQAAEYLAWHMDEHNHWTGSDPCPAVDPEDDSPTGEECECQVGVISSLRALAAHPETREEPQT